MDFCYYPALPAGLLDDDLLTVLPEERCPYLPGRRARYRAFLTGRLSAAQYHRLMDRGFRRSGELFYQPVCVGCRECVPIRVPVAGFTPSKTQRRVWRENQDLVVAPRRPEDREELLGLFLKYQREWHQEERAEEGAEAYLFDSPVVTEVFTYRLDGRIVAAGVCDVSRDSLSSVYFFFDPELKGRSLGTFGALWEMEYARRAGIPYYYLGYWVRGCGAMAYKARFRPYELLGADGIWRAG